MTRKRYKKIFLHFYTDARGVWVFGMLLVFLCVAYFLFTAQTVSNIVERQRSSQELALLDTKIGELEFEYIRKKSSINLASADQFDMTQQNNATYITRPVLGQRIEERRQL